MEQITVRKPIFVYSFDSGLAVISGRGIEIIQRNIRTVSCQVTFVLLPANFRECIFLGTSVNKQAQDRDAPRGVPVLLVPDTPVLGGMLDREAPVVKPEGHVGICNTLLRGYSVAALPKVQGSVHRVTLPRCNRLCTTVSAVESHVWA